jgi:hypothetical protein
MLIAYATAEGELASDLGEGAGPYAKVRVELSRQIERFILARGGCAGERGRRTAPKSSICSSRHRSPGCRPE